MQRLLLGLLLVMALHGSGAAKPKGASLTVKARFNSTSYLLEAIEFLAEEDPALVWSFIDRVTAWGAATATRGGASDADTDAGDGACWRNITSEAAALVTPGVAKLLPLVLGSRQYAAKLQMVRQLAEQLHPGETACCFVSVDGRVAATPLSLRDLLDSTPPRNPGEAAAEQLFSFDHVYDNGAGSSPDRPHHTAVLYGSPGLPCFAPLHMMLKWEADRAAKEAEAGAAQEGGRGRGFVYAFRPLLLQACEPFSGCARAGTGGPLLLPGWGVEAALKNTEYSAMDDKEAAKQRQQKREAEAEAEAAGSEAEEGDASSAASSAAAAFGSGESAVVRGFRLDVLAARRPGLRQELLTFRDALLAGEAEEEEEGGQIKVWDLADVGLQASQRILGSQDPLGLLAEMSGGFPGLVASLSRQPVNASLRSSVSHNANYLGSSTANYLLVNGLAVDVNNLDYFGFLSLLRSEARLHDSLVGDSSAGGLGLPPSLAAQLLALRAQEGTGDAGGGGGEEPRLNLGPASTMSAHVAWLNDLEKDARYQRFSRSITDILNTFPGRLRPLARNAFTAVFVAEPLCGASLELAAAVEQMWQGGYPVRFGVVFHLPSVVARTVQQRRYPYLAAQVPTWAEMDASERFGRAFATLREAFGSPAAWRLWAAAGEAVGEGLAGDPGSVVEEAFVSAWAAAARSPPPGARAKAAARKGAQEALKMLMEGTGYAAEVGMQLADTASWLLAKGLVEPPPSSSAASAAAGGKADEDAEACDSPPLVWLNGITGRPAGGANPAEDLMYKIMGEMQRLQEWVYFGRLSDASAGGDVTAAVLGLAGAVERLNPRIIGPKAQNTQIVPLGPLLRHPAHAALRPLWPGDGESGSKSKSRSKSGSGSEAASGPRVAHVTHYVVADLSSDEGRGLVAEALRFLAAHPAARESRLVLVGNPAAPASPPSMLEAVVRAALGQGGAGPSKKGAKVVSFLTRLLGDAALVARLGGDLNSGSAEEARVAARYADEAGLDGQAILVSLVSLVDEGMGEGGTVRGGTPSQAYRAHQAHLAGSVLGLERGAAAVVSNGRLTHVFTPSTGEHHELQAEDFALLQHGVGGGAAPAVADALARAHGEMGPGAVATGVKGLPAAASASDPAAPDALSDLAAAVAAALGGAAAEGRSAGGGGGGSSLRLPGGTSKQLQSVLGMLRGKAVQLPGSPDSPFSLSAVLNPLSRAAQRLAPLLLLLRDTLDPPLSLRLQPQRDISEMPLKSYYRYALPSGLSGGGPPGPPAASFPRLPSRRVLTLNLDVPEAWLVEPAAAPFDLDNLRLEDVEGQVADAEYELESLMLTGSCVDVTASGRLTPPRGLQLHLGTPSSPHVVDTLVMANLAYFQLKAAPGLWLLSLAPGRSRELYSLVSSTGTSLDSWPEEGADEGAAGPGQGQGDDVSTQVLISSFMGKHMILRVRKRPGREGEDMLLQAGEAEALRQQEEASSFEADDDGDDEYDDDSDDKPAVPAAAGRRGAAAALDPANDTIHVFTVASGHMYERLQKIMFLSVVRHTKSKVKFWIIKNYMSPQHKQVVPALAAKYGFEYEFVTYKWPHWLHKQTDKQRLIWAYKILFLDVLFPLSLDRIIFVDSDQVVRSDLAELYHMDIRGAPYAYTPFCDNNADMDEYRFWKGGFWRDHLQGKPYHISALYLVDLKRFRQIAAGDQLRVVYDQLSKDPNSLANLDQDLPNYAQHSIRIHSLPQEWLWCESWCGNATKAKARTIDLCNNPRTKEPKLSAARRIIGPLWEQLDAQQEDVTREVQRRLEAEAEAAGAAGGPAAGSAEEGAQEPGLEMGAGVAEGEAAAGGVEAEAEWAEGGVSDAGAEPVRGDRSEF